MRGLFLFVYRYENQRSTFFHPIGIRSNYAQSARTHTEKFDNSLSNKLLCRIKIYVRLFRLKSPDDVILLQIEAYTPRSEQEFYLMPVNVKNLALQGVVDLVEVRH